MAAGDHDVATAVAALAARLPAPLTPLAGLGRARRRLAPFANRDAGALPVALARIPTASGIEEFRAARRHADSAVTTLGAAVAILARLMPGRVPIGGDSRG